MQLQMTIDCKLVERFDLYAVTLAVFYLDSLFEQTAVHPELAK